MNTPENEESRKIVKGLYDALCEKKFGDNPESVERRVAIIRKLESTMRTEFKSTEDFHFKCRSFIAKAHAVSPGKQLKSARKKMVWNQKTLAYHFGCTQQFVTAMENDEKPLTKKAVFFMDLANSACPNKPQIIKELQEWGKKDDAPYAEEPKGCILGVDNKRVTVADRRGPRHQELT